MKFLLIALLFISCSSVGPNYNVGKTHNESLKQRNKVVSKQDRNMKRKMIKLRKQSIKTQKIKTKTNNKYI